MVKMHPNATLICIFHFWKWDFILNEWIFVKHFVYHDTNPDVDMLQILVYKLRLEVLQFGYNLHNFNSRARCSKFVPSGAQNLVDAP